MKQHQKVNTKKYGQHQKEIDMKQQSISKLIELYEKLKH